MYLVIKNRGSMNRIALTLFGYSTKRDRMDDPTIIGNKGSGLKLAALAAMRLGLHVAVSSTDHCGRYFLSYEKEDVAYGKDVVPQIMLDWQEHVDGGIASYREPWNMSVEAFRDWNHAIGADDTAEFKMFREYLANAYDEDKAFRLEYADECSFAKHGETAVFIQCNDGLERILRHRACYFTFLSDSRPHAVIGALGEIRGKSQRDATRLFVNGVMVECTKEPSLRSTFDYVLQDKTLVSEERIIKDRSRFIRALGTMLVEGVRKDELARLLLKAMLVERCLEASAFATVYRPSEEAKTFWREVLYGMAGTKDLCTESGNPSVDSDAEQLSGHRVLRGIPYDTKAFLERIGIPSATDVVPKASGPGERGVSFNDIVPTHQELFLAEFRLLAKYFRSYSEAPIRFYQDLTGKDTRVGYCVLAAKEPVNAIRVVCGEEGYVFPQPECIRTVLRHEPRHIETQFGDSDRRFMVKAEDELDELVGRLEGHASTPKGAAILPVVDVPDALPTFSAVSDRQATATRDRHPFGPDLFEESKSASAPKTTEELVQDLLQIVKDAD